MSLTAFVSGASGFVGSNLVRELHEQGWTVHILARPTSSLEDIAGTPVTLHTGDIVDAASVKSALPPGVDAVFHVAASTNFWSKKNDEQTRINVDGTRNMIAAALGARARRFIHTSSFVTWGFQDRVLTEDSPRTDTSDWINYVRTKSMAEQLVLDAVSENQLDAVVLNPANVLGPGDRHSWSRMISMVHRRKLPGAPPAGGNFCDVREVAKAHVQAFHKGRTGEKYLLGGEFAKFVEVIGIAGEILGKPVPERPMPAWLLKASAQVTTTLSSFTGREPELTPEAAVMTSHNIVCDSGKAERELEYRSVPLRKMIGDTIAWMNEKELLR